MFSLIAGILGGQLPKKPAATEPYISTDAYVAPIQLQMEQEAGIWHVREKALKAAAVPFKVADQCPCCGSHDYITHNKRDICYYCRVPQATQPFLSPRLVTDAPTREEVYWKGVGMSRWDPETRAEYLKYLYK